jgi:hypothetical protein
MRGFERSLIILFSALVLIVSACGNPLENSSTDGVSFTPQPLGMDYCYTCHNDPGSNQVFEQVFTEWIQSRHANFDFMWGGPADPFANTVLYGSIGGNPPLAFCGPCHDGTIGNGNIGGSILDSNVGGALFPDPNLGERSRPLINCEACHVSGTGHFGGSSPPEVAIPAFNECTECHPPTPSLLSAEPFADAAHTDHHGPSSTHMWAYGNTIVDDILVSGDSWLVATTLVLASESFEAYQISAGWLAANGGTWFFDGHETINDTHYQGIWITDVPNEIVVYEVPTSKFGYVDLSNTSPNSGMVRADSVDSCTASCHGAHEFNLAINEQWFEGAHHPNIEGPLGTTTSRGSVVLDIPGPANWGAVDHGYDEDCLRCHTSMGFAEIAPGYGDAVQTPSGESDGFITCNACHDGVDYPTSVDKHLRFSGSVPLFDYQGIPLANVQAGNSAVCVYCHQGREDGSHVDADIASGTPAFRNMHYLPAGATLFGMKGYEYTGETYAGEHTFHVIAGCAGCHMADNPPIGDVGGHTFHMAYGSTENVAFCAGSCHPNMNSLDDPVDFEHGVNWDGNGGTVSAKDEVAYLLTVLLHDAIEAYDSPDDADTMANIDYSSRYPYFGTTDPTQQWDGVVAKAAFNWQFIFKDPGAYAHNPKYAVQLLRDSYNDLAYAQSLAGAPSIPALGGTRP